MTRPRSTSFDFTAAPALALVFLLSCGNSTGADTDTGDTARDDTALADIAEDARADIAEDARADIAEDAPADIAEDPPADTIDDPVRDVPLDTADDPEPDAPDDPVSDSVSDAATDAAADIVTDTGEDASDAAVDDSGPGWEIPDRLRCDNGGLDAFTRANIDPPWRDSGGYADVDSSFVAALTQALDAVWTGRPEDAASSASSSDYTLCFEGMPTEGIVFLVPESATGLPLVALRLGEARGLIVETPHSFFDTDTLAQGVVVFEDANARALIASGTHRCASPEYTPCSGMTSVCGDESERYRVSDMAHSTISVFQGLHVAIAERYADDLVVSLHGFGQDGISLSNGTTDDVADDSPVAQLATAFSTEFSGELITTCNDYTGANVDNRLCGTTNTQGRHLNESADACTAAADAATDRFVHMEQSRAIRDEASRVASVIASVVD